MSLAARRRLDAARFKRTAEESAPDRVIDATAIDEPSNSDEALALYALYAEPGDTLTLHSEWCRTHLDAAEQCTCTPVALVVGATA